MDRTMSNQQIYEQRITFVKDREPNSRKHNTTLDIHIMQPTANISSILSWRDLASIWDRNATFDIISRISRPFLLPSIPLNNRVVIIMHLSPKMGSMSLRKACTVNMNVTCGRKSRNRLEPDGFYNGTELASIIQQCNSTYHYCLGREIFHQMTKRFKDTTFFHLYPFRNYDSWSSSALKQAFDREGVRGCEKVDKLFRSCSDNHPERAFYKYSKVMLSKDRPLIIHRVNIIKEAHHVVIYPYHEISNLLSKLNKHYPGVPLLPGSDNMLHRDRPVGKCDESLLDSSMSAFLTSSRHYHDYRLDYQDRT
jgi:hypothetical protein